MIRGDLTRFIYEDTYTTTFITRVFQCLIVITARFKLELFSLSILLR